MIRAFLTRLAASYLARQGARQRAETLDAKRRRVRAELEAYVANKRQITTGEGFL